VITTVTNEQREKELVKRDEARKLRETKKLEDAEKRKTVSSVNGNSSNAYVDQELVGEWSTKTVAVITKCAKISANDDKVVIFSLYPEYIAHIGKALAVNNLGFVDTLARTKRMTFGKAIDMWKGDETKTALLLHVHAAAAGLTLVEANHMIVCEPLINPAQYSQAISRIHRIGQTKTCYVHNLFVKDSIEEKIHKESERIAYDDNLSASLARNSVEYGETLLERVFANGTAIEESR